MLVAGAQVYILGRMGNATKALHLIVERLADIPQAIAFVQSQQDDDLWQLLISLAFGSASTAGEGTHLNPYTIYCFLAICWVPRLWKFSCKVVLRRVFPVRGGVGLDENVERGYNDGNSTLDS